MVCDSDTAKFRVPHIKLDKLQQLLRRTLAAGHPSFGTLQQIARSKRMSMTVAMRPASLWTHAMFAVVAGLDKSGWCAVNLSHDSKADLVSEFKQLLGCLLYTSPSPRDLSTSRMPSSA